MRQPIINIAFLTAAAVLTMQPVQPVSAAAVATLDQLNNGSITLAQQYQGKHLTIYAEDTMGELFLLGSGFAIETQDGTGSQTAGTVAHVVDSFENPAYNFVEMYVGFGPNFFTDRGQMVRVSSYMKHEDWSSLDDFQGWEPDVAGLVLDEFVPGAGASFAASTELGMVGTSVGAGLPALPGNVLDMDGWVRGFDLPFESRGLFETSNDYIWGGFDLGDPITYGVATDFDSGSGVYDQFGDILGITARKTLSSPNFGAKTGIWDAQATVGWYYANGFVPVPEPSSLSVMLLGGLAVLRRRRAG